MFKFLRYTIIFTLLTVVTQVGGVIYLLCLFTAGKFLNKNNKLRYHSLFSLLFVTTYFIFTFAIIPPVAKLSGRVALPTFIQKSNIRPLNYFTFLLNRHYVTEEYRNILSSVENKFYEKYPNSNIYYLDANFPFWDGFPLLPHLSHNDGEKLDLALFYIDTVNSENINDNPSYFGYGTYVEPNAGETNTTLRCKESGYWQYDLTGKIFPAKRDTNLIFDKQRTKTLIDILSNEKDIRKIFIEPHLKDRMQLNGNNKVKFHGCHAVRHDDHIHVQL